MAISLVGSGNNYESFSTTIVLSISSGSISEGDAMIAVLNVAENTDLMSAAPSGWTLINKADYGSYWGYCYKKQAGAAESNSYTWTLSSADRIIGAIGVWTGVETGGTCFGDTPNGTADTTYDTDLDAPSITIDTSGNVAVHLSVTDGDDTHAPPGGTPTYTEEVDVNSAGGNISCGFCWATYTSTGATGVKSGSIGENSRNISWHVELLILAAVPSLEQEGFRWRNDDGSESAATWAQSQDVDDTIAKNINTRLRTLINATNDPDSEQFELQYKRTADGAAEWRKVPEA